MANESFPGFHASDDAFGPASHTRDFDFTLTFEQSILTILPSVMFICAGSLRLVQLFRRTPRTLPNYGHTLKTIAATVYMVLQLALIVLWSSSHPNGPTTSIPSAAISFVASGIILLLSHFEDRKATRPSTLLNIYLVLSTLFEAAEIRTLWTVQHDHIAAVQSASIGVKIGMLFLEARQKRPYLLQPYKDYPPEATSGFWNLTFVWWLNRLFIIGFQKLLTTQDLFDIDRNLTSKVVGHALKDSWDDQAPDAAYALPVAVAWCFRWTLLAAAFPRLCLIGFNFAQPFLIVAAIENLKNPGASKNDGYGLIGAAFLIYLGIAMSTVHFNRKFSRFTTMLRGGMISLLYNKTLQLQDGLGTQSAVLTHMSTDLDNAIEFLEKINNIWACVLEIAVGIWLLERQIGATCVVPLIVALVCVVGQGQVATSIGKYQQQWNEAIQERVKNTSSMLGSIKEIKVTGLGDNISTNIQTQREQELKSSRPFFWGIIWLNGLSAFPKIWAPAISFIVFAIQAKVRGTDSLDTVQAFASLSIITLVTSPAEQLLAVIPQLAAALGCFSRLQGYLRSPSMQDSRIELSFRKCSLSSNTNEKDGSQRSIPQDSSRLDHAIVVENVTVCPAPTATEAALHDITFALEAGSLTVLLGPIGSGKSTLLKAILGELPCKTGEIKVNSKKIAYCSQSPWLMNLSVKETICGSLGSTDEDLDSEWYETVLHACALDHDIQQWPNGDQTVVGSKGITLSGGQKHRVALGRALYTKQPIVLLDDIFSALDNKTQNKLSTRLLSKDGLFRRLSTTMIFVTNTVKYIRLADRILGLDPSGKLVMQGTYDELSNMKEFSVYANELVEAIPESDSPASEDVSNSNESSQVAETDKMMELTRRTGDLKIYKYYIRNVEPAIWIGFVIVTALVAFAENFPVVWLNWWVQAGGQQLSLYLPVYAALALIATVSSMISIWVMFMNLMPRAAIRLHHILLKMVMNAPPAFFANTDSGVILNRFSQDMSLVDLQLPIATSTVLGSLFGCIAQIALISTGSSYMALTIPFTLLAIYGIQNVYLKTSRQLRYLDLENKSPLFTHFMETLDGLATLRAFGWETKAMQTFDRHLDHSQRPYYMLLCIQRWLNLVLDLLVTALAVIVIALAVNLKSTTAAGLLGLSLNNILGFNKSLSTLVTSWTSLETSLGAVARVKTFAETTESEEKSDESYEPPAGWPSSGSIEIDHVSATYGSDIQALDEITMSIKPGEKIGICGRTGSGKTSLLNSILRVIPISSGSITVDNVNINTVSPAVLRQKLTIVPQESFILPGTVRVNADPLGLASDATIIAALRDVGIWDALEGRSEHGGSGLDTILFESPLSQGQQQLFGLTRVMLRHSTVVIIDEGTSSVDSETDAMVQRVIKEKFKDCTVICVAHRLHTIKDCDKIAVMDGGRLVEFDSPQRLLARESLFKDMYHA
ncbi:ABC transporter family protein [Cadophora sp. MPI-SDFR-AT-0126]|nr:ABC transporter family protein [Leotiomycetes sp. MPI-SDFR-AT-0126]